jgi:hypothetical protein
MMMMISQQRCLLGKGHMGTCACCNCLNHDSANGAFYAKSTDRPHESCVCNTLCSNKHVTLVILHLLHNAPHP